MEDVERYVAFVEQSYQEKRCFTCKYYIPVPDELPGYVSAYPECKHGGFATKTCQKYKSDNEKREYYDGYLNKWRERILKSPNRKEQ